MRRVYWAAAMAMWLAASQGKGGDITLVTTGGTELKVPATGPKANATARQIAQEVAAFDKRQASGHGPKKGTDPQVGEAMERLTREIRDDTVDRLDLSYRLADTTSGPPDEGVLEGARKSADLLKEIMSAPPPPKLNVATAITTSEQNAVLHYCLRGDYKRNACAWQSYSAGDTMPIGLYMFRVEAAAGGALVIEEQVLVLNDPTRRLILPRGGRP